MTGFAGLGVFVVSLAFVAIFVLICGAVSVNDPATGGFKGGCIAGLIGAPFTFGASAVGGCGALVINSAIGIASGVALGLILGAVIAAITPAISNMLTRDLVSNLGGEDLVTHWLLEAICIWVAHTVLMVDRLVIWRNMNSLRFNSNR